MSKDNSKRRPASVSLSQLDSSGLTAHALKTAEPGTPAKESNVYPVFKDAKQGKKAKLDEDSNGVEQQL